MRMDIGLHPGRILKFQRRKQAGRNGQGRKAMIIEAGKINQPPQWDRFEPVGARYYGKRGKGEIQ
jgi:hypothetical protein